MTVTYVVKKRYHCYLDDIEKVSLLFALCIGVTVTYVIQKGCHCYLRDIGKVSLLLT